MVESAHLQVPRKEEQRERKGEDSSPHLKETLTTPLLKFTLPPSDTIR